MLHRGEPETTGNTLCQTPPQPLDWSGHTVVLIPVLCCPQDQLPPSFLNGEARRAGYNKVSRFGNKCSCTDITATGCLVSPVYPNPGQVFLPISSHPSLWQTHKSSWKLKSCWWPEWHELDPPCHPWKLLDSPRPTAAILPFVIRPRWWAQRTPQSEPGMSLSGFTSDFPALHWPGCGVRKLFLFHSGNDHSDQGQAQIL